MSKNKWRADIKNNFIGSFDTPEEAGKYLVDNKPDNKVVYVAELTPTPLDEVAEELPHGFGKNIKEALKEYEDGLTLESGDIVRNVVTERVEVVRHSSVEMHKSHYFIKIK